MKDKLTDNHGAMDREFEELQRCVERRQQHFRQLMQEEEDRVRLSSLEGVRAAALSQAGVLDGLVGSSPDDALLGSERTMLTRLAQLDAQAAMMDAVQDPVTIMPDPHKLRLLKSAIAMLDQVQDQAEGGRAYMESDQIQVSIPNNLLEKVDLSKIMGWKSGNVGKIITTAFVKLEDFVNTAIDLRERIGNRPSEQQAEEQTTTPGAEADSSAGWSSNVDQLEVEALRFLLGAEFDQTLDVKENQGRYLLTFKGAPSKALENQVDSLRQEDVQLTPEEISKFGDTVDLKSEGIEAFVKTVPSHGKAAVFAFDYTAMTKAKHLVIVKTGRVKVTTRTRRRFDTGTPGQVDETPAQSVEVPGHGRGSIMQTADFTTPSGVKPGTVTGTSSDQRRSDTKANRPAADFATPSGVKSGTVTVTSSDQQRSDTKVNRPAADFTTPSGVKPGTVTGTSSDQRRSVTKVNMPVADFTTPSGVRVSVHKTNITKLPVDAIVNAANENLAHGGGVALAISKAAGFALEDEGRQHLVKHGPLRVTEVVETTAGGLPCKKVLHAVGPRWDDYTDKTWCGQHLVDTVFNCLQKADSLGFTSIALPSISAAILGVPQDVCADSYLSAVKKFDERHGRSTSVRYVHFVDVNDAMISTIQGTFTAQWSAPASSTAGGQAGHTTAAHGATRQETTGPAQSMAEGTSESTQIPQRPWNIPPTSEPHQIPQRPLNIPPTSEPHQIPQRPLASSPTSESTQIPQRPWDMNPSAEPRQDMKTGVQGQTTSSMALSQQEPVGFPSLREVGVDKERQAQISFKDLNLSLILQKQSVVDMETEAVILWQDVKNIMKDNIWKHVSKKLSPHVTAKANELKKDMSTVSTVVDLKTANKQFVFIVLSFNTSYGEDKIRDFVEQALNKVDLAQKTTVAITRIAKQKDKASNKDREDLEAFIKGLYTAVKNYGQRGTKAIKEIHVAEIKPSILESMVDIMKTVVGVDRSLQEQAASRPSSVPAGPLSRPPQSPDPCAVCRNKPSDPKSLSCGHVFCRVCIDHWFQSKPTCPVCNAIHGTISGNQPEDGRMKMTHSYGRCEGFPWGMFTVEYSFPSGTQKENHPHPGMRYTATARRAYLPDTPEGSKVLMLLKVAFDRRLIFTIGRSVTSGDVGIVWNDIHHKTQTSGGPESHGYPDADYLVRVMAELADKGITEKDLTDTHRHFINNPTKFCGGVFSSGDFSHKFKA